MIEPIDDLGLTVLSRILWHAFLSSRVDKLPREEFLKHQRERLQQAIAHGYSKTKFWRNWLDRSGVRPDDIMEIEDLRRIRVCTKYDLLAQPLEDRMADDPKNCIVRSSSGTTGGPMKSYYSKSYYDYLAGYYIQGHYLRIRGILGIGPLDKLMRITHGNPSDVRTISGRTKSLGFTSRLVGPLHDYFARNVTLGDDIDEILPEIRKFKPDFIKSTPSYLRLLAHSVSSEGIEEIRPKALMTGGEVLDEPTRKYLQEVFGCKTYQGYSASEIGKIGFECETRIGLHVSDSVIVEILKDGSPTLPGESGNIVVTCLLNDAMPMIRYDLGDVGSWANSPCSCGRNTPLLESVDGRREDHLTFSPNRIISPKSLMSMLHRDMSLPPSQLVQETDDVCRLRVFAKVKSKGISNLLDEVQAFLGSQTKVELSLEPSQELRVKFRPVISYKNLRDKRWTLVN